MTYIKSALGYLIAFLSIILAIATFASDGIIGKIIVKRGNLVVAPNISGGNIIKTIHNNGYRVDIHEPVFLGLFKPKKKGFIQIDFFKDKNVPTFISEDIDFDEDNEIDFSILYNASTNHAEIKSYHPNVSTRFMGIKRKSAYTVRIDLTNPDY